MVSVWCVRGTHKEGNLFLSGEAGSALVGVMCV